MSVDEFVKQLVADLPEYTAAKAAECADGHKDPKYFGFDTTGVPPRGRVVEGICYGCNAHLKRPVTPEEYAKIDDFNDYSNKSMDI